VTPPTTGTIKIEQRGDKNITINHGCGGGNCGGGGNSGCNNGGDGGKGGGRELTVVATEAVKTNETMKMITVVAKAIAGALTVMTMSGFSNGKGRMTTMATMKTDTADTAEAKATTSRQ